MQIMFNRCVTDRSPLAGVNEYVVFKAGETVRRFESSPEAATRYARRYALTFASPMDFWRDVVCA